MIRTSPVILNCGVCGEEHWHYPPQAEVICIYCEQWVEAVIKCPSIVSFYVCSNNNVKQTRSSMEQYGGGS